MPDGAADLVADLYRRIPDVRITDILLEVDDATRFTEAFTHLRTGSPCRDRIGLLNVLLAEGINLGLRKMAEATTTHGFWELMRIARWHVEGEAYDRALSMVVEAQAALPMAAVWGTGRTASSDGQFFPAAGRGEALNLVNARHGTEPGVKAYSHVSDRFSPPFATQTIPATVREAPYILDGFLMNETRRRVREQYADTGGFTDHVFAACSILGYAFVPRIRDLPSKRLYVFRTRGRPEALAPTGRRRAARRGQGIQPGYMQKTSRLTNSEAKSCPDLVERFGALRPDERWMTAPRGEVAERADASIRQDSVIQAAWRRFQPLRRSSPRGRPRASYSATGP